MRLRIMIAIILSLISYSLVELYIDQMELKKYAAIGRICELEHGERE